MPQYDKKRTSDTGINFQIGDQTSISLRTLFAVTSFVIILVGCAFGAYASIITQQAKSGEKIDMILERLSANDVRVAEIDMKRSEVERDVLSLRQEMKQAIQDRWSGANDRQFMTDYSIENDLIMTQHERDGQ